MYLSCVRAVEYLKSRPDWDGKTLVVMGTSQGGQQALVAGGAAAGQRHGGAAVPARGVRHARRRRSAGRRGSRTGTCRRTGKDAKKVRETSRYYDPVNFAAQIKCPVLDRRSALHDDLAPPSSVLAAANLITAPKEIVILPNAGHQDEKGSQKPYNDRGYGAWLPALRQGKPAPVASPRRPTSVIGRRPAADQPAAQNDDPVWVAKHTELRKRAKQGGIDLYFAGDSITRRWPATHRESWDRNFGGWRAASFGAGGDRTQNVLYRLENGELDGVNPKVVVLLIGTNNVGFDAAAAGRRRRLVADTANGRRRVRPRDPQARTGARRSS